MDKEKTKFIGIMLLIVGFLPLISAKPLSAEFIFFFAVMTIGLILLLTSSSKQLAHTKVNKNS